METHITKLTIEHIQDVQRLSEQLGYPMSVQDIETNIIAVSTSQDHIAFVALQNEKVVGWIHAFKGLLLESRPFIEIGGLVVDDDQRGKGIGKELSKYYLKNDYYIAIGFSPKSQIIHQKMGARKIGHLSFYRKWASPIHQFKSLFNKSLRIKPKSVISYTFPDEVNGFMRVKSPARLILPQLNWNENTIESIRNKEYFEWRFFL